MRNKIIWIIVALIVIVFGTYMATVANATTLQLCHGDYKINCITPTPKVDCDKEHGHNYGKEDRDKCPTSTPTITPTPTVKPCFTWIDEKIVPCISPTTTPTPIASPSATPTPGNNNSRGSGGDGQSNQAPRPAVCEIPFQAPILQGFSADGNGSVTFSWWPSPNVTKYSITYGYAPDKLIYGEDNIPSTSTSLQINGLTPGQNVWAQVQAWQGGCEESSNLFDPIVL